LGSSPTEEIDLEWLIPVVAGLAALGALYASQPQNRRLAHVSAFLMVFIAGWQGYSSYKNWETQGTVAKYAHSRLYAATYSLVEMFHRMTVEASDGWLPSIDDELFSAQAAKLVCQNLNLDAQAPVVPERSWLVRIHQQTRDSKEEFDSVLNSYAPLLDDNLLKSAINLRRSFLLNFPAQWVLRRQIDANKGYERPPLLCFGIETLMQESLQELRSLYQTILDRSASKAFSYAETNAQFMASTGAARFSDQDLATWMQDHPFAPSGRPVE
jgi:hypothetical protein